MGTDCFKEFRKIRPMAQFADGVVYGISLPKKIVEEQITNDISTTFYKIEVRGKDIILLSGCPPFKPMKNG